jgi:protease-4
MTNDTHANTPPSSATPGLAGQGAASVTAAEREREPWAYQTLEKVFSEWLRERRSERRWTLFRRSLWLVLFLTVVVWVIVASHTGGTVPIHTPHTALVELQGEIASDTTANAQDVMDALREAFENPQAKAIILHINSPGGSPVQAGLMNDEITRLKHLYKKPIYAVVEESCASGAYYVAVATDQIVVNKASIVGSIGVLVDGFGFTGLMQKLGVERRLLTAGNNKGFLDPFSPQSPEHQLYAKAMLEEIHAQFIAAVRKGRGQRLKETPELFSGLFWTGQQALELGLADRLGSVDSVAREWVRAPTVVDYTHHQSVTERLVKRFGEAMGAGAFRALQTQGAVPVLR